METKTTTLADELRAAFAEACAVEENHAWETILSRAIDRAAAALEAKDNAFREIVFGLTPALTTNDVEVRDIARAALRAGGSP